MARCLGIKEGQSKKIPKRLWLMIASFGLSPIYPAAVAMPVRGWVVANSFVVYELLCA